MVGAKPTCSIPSELKKTTIVMIMYCTGYKKEQRVPRTHRNIATRGSIILFNTAKKPRKGALLLAIGFL